jgi:hypothetical protein
MVCYGDSFTYLIRSLCDKLCPKMKIIKHVLEQIVNVKFCVKLQRLPSETLQMLSSVHSKSIRSKNNVFKWYKSFSEGGQDVND